MPFNVVILQVFYKLSHLWIGEHIPGIPALLEQGVCIPWPSGTGSIGVNSELFSSEPGEERDKQSLFQTLFPHSQSCGCWLCGRARGAAPPLDPQQELQLLVPVPVLTKTWHYPQPQLAKLPCDLPQMDMGPVREFCAQIWFGLGFLLVFHLTSKTRCSGVGSFPWRSDCPGCCCAQNQRI